MPFSDRDAEENENGGEVGGVGGVGEGGVKDDDNTSELTALYADFPPPRPTMIREEKATTEGADVVVVDQGESEARTETRRERRVRKRMEREARRRGENGQEIEAARMSFQPFNCS